MASSQHAQLSRYHSLEKSYVHGGQSIPWIHAAEAAVSALSRTSRRIALRGALPVVVSAALTAAIVESWCRGRAAVVAVLDLVVTRVAQGV
jgi:hypothetical protein